jgi:hypothetical protein
MLQDRRLTLEAFMRWSTHGLITIGVLVILLTQVLCTAWVVAVERDVKTKLGSLNDTVRFLLVEQQGHKTLCGGAHATANQPSSPQ